MRMYAFFIYNYDVKKVSFQNSDYCSYESKAIFLPIQVIFVSLLAIRYPYSYNMCYVLYMLYFRRV